MRNAPRIIVNSDVLAPAAMKILTERGAEIRTVTTHAPAAEMIKALTEAPTHAILVRSTPIDAAVLAASPELRVISKHGVGYDNIDVRGAARRGIPVLRAYAANARSVAELALSMMLVLMRRMLPLDAAIRAGRWEQSLQLGRELTGARLGIVGCGAVGTSLVELSRGFCLSVMAYDPYLAAEAFPAGVQRVDRLDRLFAEADIVSLHCPLTDETRMMIDAAALRQMKASAVLVNAARGPLVDADALVAALSEKHLAGAGLDTFIEEPPAADHPLWALPNVVVTPHVGGSTQEALSRVAVQAVENIFTVLDGRTPDPRFVVT
jgi:D-3-phosphoglycerate dehydrogenase